MPRTLPWMRTAVPTTTSPTSASSPASGERPAKRRKEAVSKEDVSVKASLSRSRQLQRRSSRTPSTSPPPMPPSQEPMRPSDNGWIMVEDELYAVAQSYTKHLHWTEYKRLKERAAQKRTDIAIIDRPVDGRSEMSKTLKLQKKHEEKRLEISEAVRNIGARNGSAMAARDESEDDEEVLIGDRNLAGLMLGTGKNKNLQRSLLQGTSKNNNTRAAAGFVKQTAEKGSAPFSGRLYDIPGLNSEVDNRPGNSKHGSTNNTLDLDDDDENDLDLPSLRSSNTGNVAAVKPPTAATSILHVPTRDRGDVQSIKENISNQRDPIKSVLSTATTSNQKFTSKPKPVIKHESKTFDYEGLPSSVLSSISILERTKARTVLKKSREEKNIKLEEIPSFMM